MPLPYPVLVISSLTLQNFIVLVDGPVNYNGRRYTALNIQDYPAANSSLGVAMSSDDGATWAVQDAVNQPVNVTGNANVGQFYPKSGGNTIWYAFAVNANPVLAGPLHLRPFNMDTNTWGADIPGGPNANNEDTYVFQLGDGSFVVIYDDGASPNRSHWVTYNGAWGASTLIPLEGGAAESFVLAALKDPNDRMHFLIEYDNSPNIWYGQTFNGVATTPVDTGTLIGTTANVFYGYGDYVAASDEVVFPTSFTTNVEVLRIHPSAAPTSFTLQVVNSTDVISGNNQVRFAVSPDGTQELFTWLNSDFAHLDKTQIFYALKPAGSGAWSASTLVWQYNLNPPQPTPPTDGVEALWEASWSSDGVVGYTLAGFATSASVTFCDIAYYISITFSTCPIVIGAGPSGSGPCENPGTNPALDSYLELRKVLVAWKKETHLPVRGKS